MGGSEIRDKMHILVGTGQMLEAPYTNYSQSQREGVGSGPPGPAKCQNPGVLGVQEKKESRTWALKNDKVK